MPFAPAPTLLRTIVPDAAGNPGKNGAFYGRRQRPWSAGYRARFRAEAAQALYGVNHPGETSPNVIRIQGAGAAAGATPASYTPVLPTGVALPQDTAFATAGVYLDALLYIFAGKDVENALLLRRLPKGVADDTTVGQGFWRIDSASAISISTNYAAGPLYSDLPVGWNAILVIPPASAAPALVWTFAAGGLEQVLPVNDFMAVGNNSSTAAVAINRVMQ